MIAAKTLPPPPDRAPVRRALLSVSDKAGLADFGRRLAALGVELLSTGGTAAALREAGVPVVDVAEATGFPEILDGRVKSLHPAIHGGILARRTDPDDLAQLSAHGIGPIDLVVVNLYPFREAVARPGVTDAVAVENVDIGGPAMLRAAAKNFAFVAALVDPSDYAAVADELDAHDGTLGLETRRRLSGDAFAHTAAYDQAVAAYFAGSASGDGVPRASTPDPAVIPVPGAPAPDPAPETIPVEAPRVPADDPAAIPMPGAPAPDSAPETIPAGVAPSPASDGTPARLTLELAPRLALRYGENPHQAATLYGQGPAPYETLHGKALSFNNLLDLSAALALVAEFADAPPTVAILKHTNPCGVGQADTLDAAYAKAFATDRQSPFGGIVAVNRPLDRATAEALDSIFTEIVIAPAFEDGVLDFLQQKANRRLIRAHLRAAAGTLDLRTVAGGVLVQTPDAALPSDVRDTWTVATERDPTPAEAADLEFAWRICKHVKSNAIVYARGGATLGIGAGQMSRIDASEIAVAKAAKSGLDLAGSVVASDAFFPFADGLVAAAEAGAVAAIQPGGSVRDDEVIRAADQRGMAMVFTGRRHFRH